MRDFDNVGVLDTAIRSIIGVVLFALAAEGLFTTTVTWLMVLGGCAMFFSASVGLCPIYKILGIDTYHKSRQ